MSIGDRFSSYAYGAVLAADQMARRWKHPLVEPEHLLIGLLWVRSGVAARVLANLRVDREAIASEVLCLLHSGTGPPVTGKLPYAPRAERVMERASLESRNQNCKYVGSEHLLLALLCETEGIASRVLRRFHVDGEETRAEILRTAEQSSGQPPWYAFSEPLWPPPWTRTDKQFILDVYRAAVDLYQPRIEKRTGVRLGKINVEDYEQLIHHQMADWKRRLGFFKRLLYRRRIRRLYEEAVKQHAEEAGDGGATYYRNGIYVSFAANMVHEDEIAQATVHELTHALWEKLAKVPMGEEAESGTPEEWDQFKLLVEGYATYGHARWFRDVYPECARTLLPFWGWAPQSTHLLGFKRIEQLVRQFGPSILMEIPRRWRDF